MVKEDKGRRFAFISRVSTMAGDSCTKECFGEMSCFREVFLVLDYLTAHRKEKVSALNQIGNKQISLKSECREMIIYPHSCQTE